MRRLVVLLAAALGLLAAENAAAQPKNQIVPYAVEILGFDARGFQLRQRGGGDEEHVAFDDVAAFRTKNGKLQLRLAEGTILTTSLTAGELELPEQIQWHKLPRGGPQVQRPSSLRRFHDSARGTTRVFTSALPLHLAGGQPPPHTLQFAFEYPGNDTPPRDAAGHRWYLEIAAARGTYDTAAQDSAGAAATFVLHLTVDGQPILVGGDLNPAVPSQIRFYCPPGVIKRIASAKTVEGKFRTAAFRLAPGHAAAATELVDYAESATAATADQ